MHKRRVGEIHRKRDFKAAAQKIAAETRDCVGRKRNPIAISVFMLQFFRRSLGRNYRRCGEDGSAGATEKPL